MRPCASAVLVLLAVLAAPAHARRADEARTFAFDRLNEGVRAYNRGEFLKAEELLREAYDIHLNNFRAAYYLGLARMGARKYAEALEPLHRALDYRPRDLPARVSLGECQLKLGDLTAARTELYRALEVREDYSPAFDGLGRLAEASGQFERARELFLKAITADMGNPDPHMNLGLMAMREGSLAEALRELEKAVSLRPDYARALGTLARIRTRLGQYNDALAAVRRAMKLEPGNPAYAEALGRIYLALDDLRRAEEGFHAALALDPDHVEASDGLSRALRRQGKFAEAADTLDWAAARERIEAETAAEFRARARIYRFEETKLARLKRELLVENGEASTLVGAAPGASEEPGAPAVDDAVSRPGAGDATTGGATGAEELDSSGAGDAGPEPSTLVADAEGAPARRTNRAGEGAGRTGDDGDGAGPESTTGAIDEAGTATAGPPAGVSEAPTAADYAELARLSASVQDWNLAALAADRAAVLEPGDTALARQRAYDLLRAGRVLDARDAYLPLESQGRSDPEDLLNLGVTQARLGQDALAIEAYERARGTGLAPAEADLFLGLALERSGRRDEAKAALERYMDRAGERGDTAARVRRYLEMLHPPPAPTHDEVFGDDADDASAEEKPSEEAKGKEAS